MFRILVVEDDEGLQSLLAKALQKAGFQTLLASDGASALELHRANPVDLIVLDLMLPIMDGFQLLQELRPRDEVPVIMLTAMGQEPKRIQGFDLGADDYLVKPFSTVELLARIRAILRRSSRLKDFHILRSGPFLLDRVTKRLSRNGLPVSLSTVECHVLDVLMSHAGQSLTRMEVLYLAWPTHARPSPRTVDVHIVGLRKKLTTEGDPQWILSFGTRGYGWAEPVQEGDSAEC